MYTDVGGGDLIVPIWLGVGGGIPAANNQMRPALTERAEFSECPHLARTCAHLTKLNPQLLRSTPQLLARGKFRAMCLYSASTAAMGKSYNSNALP